MKLFVTKTKTPFLLNDFPSLLLTCSKSPSHLLIGWFSFPVPAHFNDDCGLTVTVHLELSVI